MSNYDEIVPPDVSGLDLGFIREIWPGTDEVMSSLYAGGGALAGLAGGKLLEKWVGSRIPKFLVPVMHATLGLAAAKFVAGKYASVGVGMAGAFGALALVRAFEIYFNSPILRDVALGGFDGADLGSISDLLGGGADVLPPELQGLDQIAIEERQRLGGLAQVQVENVGWAG